MEDFNKLALIHQSARENLLAAAREARMAQIAQPKPSRRLGAIIVATAILLGMILTLALAL